MNIDCDIEEIAEHLTKHQIQGMKDLMEIKSVTEVKEKKTETSG